MFVERGYLQMLSNDLDFPKTSDRTILSWRILYENIVKLRKRSKKRIVYTNKTDVALFVILLQNVRFKTARQLVKKGTNDRNRRA
jgi:hypothetical protein